MKQCRTCGEAKELDQYHKHKQSKDGLFGECKDCHRVRQKLWARRNKEKHALAFKNWREANPHKNSQRHKAYRVAKLGQTPPLARTSLCKLIMDEIYWYRDFLTEVTGIPHDVDHIIPISKGGEHAPWNLQVLTATENRSKGNKLDIPLQ